MASSDLEKKFKKAAWLIRNGPPKPNTPTDVKLKVWGRALGWSSVQVGLGH